jgi:CheY-like chemotaxis protein
MPERRILIVDDNPQNAKLARVLLAAEGYDVRVAVSADHALEVLTVWTPHLILMDLQLPGMDGLELTRRLKGDPTRAGMTIVAFTAYAMEGDADKAYAAGCDGYITKPIDTDRFAAEVTRYLR